MGAVTSAACTTPAWASAGDVARLQRENQALRAALDALVRETLSFPPDVMATVKRAKGD